MHIVLYWSLCLISWFQCYKLVKKLAGHSGAINCLAFSHNGEHLVSGGKLSWFEWSARDWPCGLGDNEQVRVWTLEAYKCLQWWRWEIGTDYLSEVAECKGSHLCDPMLWNWQRIDVSIPSKVNWSTYCFYILLGGADNLPGSLLGAIEHSYIRCQW
jgi:WD40 repeat protein